MTPNLEELIREYLAKASVLSLATIRDDKPWICNVWYGFDEAMNIYWFSSIRRRHSLNIKQNPFVAGAMCYPQTPQDAVRGLQFEGIAELLTDEQHILTARKTLGHAFTKERMEVLSTHPDRPHKFYRAVPELFVLFDAENFPDDPRQEYHVQR